MSENRPRILLLDQPHPKARAIMEEVAELTTDKANCIGAFVGLTKFTPDDVPIPVEFIACPCTGTDHITSVLNPDKVKIIHLDDEWKANEGREVTSTAEHTWSLILQLAKMKRMQLYGKTLGIIGFGRIGHMIMPYATSFGMDTFIYDIDKEKMNGKYTGLQIFRSFWVNKLKELFKYSDIITLHIPLAGNEGFIGEKEFAMMKDGALLINTSRQCVVNISALIPRLESGRIFYADDFKNEVDLTEYGAIQTDHIAGSCLESRELTDIYIAKKIKEYIEGGQ
jgi:phosphoglycerate dehydrogenase-like enzyme